MRRKLLIILTSLGILIVCAYFIKNALAPIPSGGTVRSHAREYEIEALQAVRNRVGYPYVWMSIEKPEYRFIYALEYIRLLNKKYDHQLLAKKRVSELLKWGTHADILLSVPVSSEPGKTTAALKSWWADNRWKMLSTQLRPFQYWEVGLARYVEHYEKYLDYGHEQSMNEELIQRRLSIAKELREDEGVIKWHINNIQLPSREEEYLLTLARDVYDHLYSIIGMRVGPYDRNLYAFYPLNEIIRHNDFGTYTGYIKKSQLSNAKGAFLKVGRRATDNARFTLTSGDHDFYQIADITISPGDTFAALSVPRAQPLEPEPQTENRTSSLYRYTISIPQAERRVDYMFAFEYHNSTASALLDVKKASTIIDTVKDRYLEREITAVRRAFKPASQPQHYEEIIYTGNQEFTKSFTVSVTLSEFDNGDSATLSLMPIYRPDLTLIRNSTAASTQSAQVTPRSPMWPYLPIIPVAVLIFVTRKRLYKVITVTNRKLTALYLVVALVLMLVDIVFIQSFDEIYLFALLFWVLFCAAVSLRLNINFQIGLSLFVLAVLANLAKMSIITEKLSRWMIIFLVWGAVYSYIRIHYKKAKGISVLDYMLKSETPYVKTLSRRIYAAVNPTRRSERIRNLITGVVIVLVMVAGTTLYYVGAKYILHSNKPPVIATFEPTIVYHANTVVLVGREFGTNADKRSHIMTDFGRVAALSWSDSKITFEVPDTLPNESVNIWIEKPASKQRDARTVTSNKIPIRIISSTNGWDEQDDEYFNQLERLTDETLRLNKYR